MFQKQVLMEAYEHVLENVFDGWIGGWIANIAIFHSSKDLQNIPFDIEKTIEDAVHDYK